MFKRLRSGRKGVEPVIAALLLIAIAVAAAIITYSWVMGMIRSQGAQSQTSIRIDVVEFASIGGTRNFIKATVRNTGSIGATIATIYIVDAAKVVAAYTTHTAITPTTTMATGPFGGGASAAVSAGSSTTFYVCYSWTAGSGYTIRVATDTGFIAESTEYAPAS